MRPSVAILRSASRAGGFALWARFIVRLNAARAHARSALAERLAPPGVVGGVGRVVGADELVPADEILDLGERSVGDGLLFALDDHAGALERLAAIDDVPLGGELLEPRHPLL